MYSWKNKNLNYKFLRLFFAIPQLPKVFIIQLPKSSKRMMQQKTAILSEYCEKVESTSIDFSQTFLWFGGRSRNLQRIFQNNFKNLKYWEHCGCYWGEFLILIFKYSESQKENSLKHVIYCDRLWEMLSNKSQL